MNGFGAFWRQLVLVFTLAAFAQAGYVTQTHIHISAGLPGDGATAQAALGKTPTPDDPAHCPFCREYLLSGAYLIPPPIILPLPATAVIQAYRLIRALSHVTALSHGWQGRAPPLH